MKHKHAELIKAWADGAEIEKKQIYCKYQMNQEPIIVSEEWLSCPSPTWSWNEEYRIKPEEQKMRDMHIYKNASMGTCWIDEKSPEQAEMGMAWQYIGRIGVFK